jgi:hypothetical protein
VLLGRARAEGPAAALEPRSRRPRTSPSRIGNEAKEQALRVRAALERSGLDRTDQRVREDEIHGPGTGALGRVAGQDLSSERCRETGAAEEAPGRVSPVRLPCPELSVAAGRDRVRPHRWP